MIMKGLAMPMNMIVIIAIAVLAVVAVGAFFMLSSGGTISDTQSYTVFSNGCTQYCKPTLYETFKALNTASETNPAFAKACVNLGYVQQGEVNLEARCLKRCLGCSMDVSEEELRGNLDELVMVSGG